MYRLLKPTSSFFFLSLRLPASRERLYMEDTAAGERGRACFSAREREREMQKLPAWKEELRWLLSGAQCNTEESSVVTDISAVQIQEMDIKPVIVVHGGAWAIPDDLAESSKDGVRYAAKCGFSVLANGGEAVQAVERAVQMLENNPVFDAGHGAVLNAEGDVELDAIIMDGRNLAVGAVSCIKNIANPVMFARTLMEKVPGAMLTGAGANKFAETMNIKLVPKEELVTELAIKEWQQYQKYKQSVTCLFNSEQMHDTVGAVAIDYEGNVACATSTGGITNKMVGRVGDCPIVGSGAYADNFSGAVSTTGHGESIMKVTLARLVLFNMDKGETPQDAADHALDYMVNKVHGRGGLITVSKTGEWAARFTTKRMAWASVKNNILTYGLNPGEMFHEVIHF